MKLTRFDSSAAELQSHMYVVLDQGYIAKETFEAIYQQTDKTSKMISCLITYLINNEKKYKQKKQEKHKKLNKPDQPKKLNIKCTI